MSDDRFIKRRRVLAVGALGAVGLGTGVSFANSSSTASFSVGSENTDFGTIEDSSTYSDTGPKDGTPSISGVTGTARSIGEGDVLFVNTFDPASDAVWFNLIINNAGDLSADFNYLNFEIGLHVTEVESPSATGEWDDVTEEVGLSSLSLTRGDITFVLENDTSEIFGGNAVSYGWSDVEHVAVTVDGGSSYLFTGSSPGNVDFYLEGREL